jgi:hypothetical protein
MAGSNAFRYSMPCPNGCGQMIEHECDRPTPQPSTPSPASGEPSTEAGRQTLRDIVAIDHGEDFWTERILAIEAEAFMDGARASRENAASLAESRATPPALDFDSASALLSAYNYWLNDHTDATVGDRYDWTKRYLARLSASGESPEPSGEPRA